MDLRTKRKTDCPFCVCYIGIIVSPERSCSRLPSSLRVNILFYPYPCPPKTRTTPLIATPVKSHVFGTHYRILRLLHSLEPVISSFSIEFWSFPIPWDPQKQKALIEGRRQLPGIWRAVLRGGREPHLLWLIWYFSLILRLLSCQPPRAKRRESKPASETYSLQ